MARFESLGFTHKAGHLSIAAKLMDNVPCRENKTGPRIDPLGTPQVRGAQSDTLSATDMKKL